MSAGGMTCVYGAPPAALAEVPKGAVQVSPLVPGAQALEAMAPLSLDGAVIAAPPGTLERRYVLANLLKALRPGAPLVALAPKEKGGSRLRKELEAFGCAVAESGRQHHRICHTDRPETLTGIEPALLAGAMRYADALSLWTQPGVFSWDRLDAGTQQLLAVLPKLAGRGMDLGCGLGVLAHAVLASDSVTSIDLIDIDRRAIDAARRNVQDPRAAFHWADVLSGPDLPSPDLPRLDFAVMNPPFHDNGHEDRTLGQAFVRRAHALLRKGGSAWLVANRHMPYEAVLNELFDRVTPRGDSSGFKIYEARK